MIPRAKMVGSLMPGRSRVMTQIKRDILALQVRAGREANNPTL